MRNGKHISIAVIALLFTAQLYAQNADSTKPGTKNLKEYILTETGEGGQLDFFSPIKGNEFQPVKLKDGRISTVGAMMLYKWGMKVHDLGVKKVQDALDIFAEFKKRKLNVRETDYITMGFDRKLE